MSNYTLLIAWSIAGCSLAAVLLIYWRYHRMVRRHNKKQFIDALGTKLKKQSIRYPKWETTSITESDAGEQKE